MPLIVILSYAIQVLSFLIIADVVVSLAMASGAKLSPYTPWVRSLRRITTPILNPVRRLLPPPHRTGGWDFSPMIVLLGLQFLSQALLSYT